MLSKRQTDYVEHIAGEAAKGILGPDAHVPNGQLADAIHAALLAIVEEAYDLGVKASMVQLSFDPGMARVVG